MVTQEREKESELSLSISLLLYFSSFSLAQEYEALPFGVGGYGGLERGKSIRKTQWIVLCSSGYFSTTTTTNSIHLNSQMGLFVEIVSIQRKERECSLSQKG